MADRPTPRISSRKQPKQARSSDLVAAILEAAIQVLASEGAARFTTARVAEKADADAGFFRHPRGGEARRAFAGQNLNSGLQDRRHEVRRAGLFRLFS